MAKITYYLGAGASYYACPILERQAELMIELANFEIKEHTKKQNELGELKFEKYNFTIDEKNSMSDDNKLQILWHIGFYGIKASEYNTIDTYARKLFLNDEFEELNLLKLSVSVFFDLFENFKDRYRNFKFQNLDNRYKSLFSILLEKNNGIKLNENFKFISWNYDLQLEETFNLFLNDLYQKDLNSINKSFKFKTNNQVINDAFHLNGYRGFTNAKESKEIILKENNSFDEYWNSIEGFFIGTKRKVISFNNHIKYAWEHNLENNPFFENIYKVLNETEILIIIGYSFPAFNRKIDQLLFSKLNSKKLKKIVYQDPNASKQLIENLFRNPKEFSSKIETLSDSKDLKQFYLPNEHFISQDGEVDLFLH